MDYLVSTFFREMDFLSQNFRRQKFRGIFKNESVY